MRTSKGFGRRHLLLTLSAILTPACSLLVSTGGLTGSPKDGGTLDGVARDAPGVDSGGTDASPNDPGVAVSCKAILASRPNAPTGTYTIYADGGRASTFSTFCDMSTMQGGWTKITPLLSDATVNQLRGSAGRMMVKCSDTGPAHLISPPFQVDWHWAATTEQLIGGTWTVNGVTAPCGTEGEGFVVQPCATFWGVGCGNGSGPHDKFFPGIDYAAGNKCVDAPAAHTASDFSICGDGDYSTYSVFVRAE
jgi:hypothetical protein